METDNVCEVLLRLPPSPGLAAMLAVLEGNFFEAAEGYAAASLLLFEAEARLRLAEQLVADGRRSEADGEISKALAFYRPNGATLFVEWGERLLSEAATG